MGAPWQLVDGKLVLIVRLTPKGGRDAIDGIDTLSDGRNVLKARVRAAPTAGEANDALCRLIAKTLALPLRDVTLSTGATARIKRLVITGDGPMLLRILEKLLETR